MAKPMIPSLPDFRRTRLHGPNRGQVKTFSYVLSAIALGRLPGEQTLSRQAVLTRLFAALALAIALWVFTTQQQNPVVSHTFSLPVVVLQGSLPKNLAIRGGLTPVRVTASGLQSSFNGTNSLSASVDLRNVPPNAREATVPVQLSGKRGDVQYTVSPPSLQLSLEPQQAKKVQVLFSPQSSLPSTLVQVGATQISPMLVTVS